MHAKQEERTMSQSQQRSWEKWKFHSEKHKYLIWSEAVANGLWEKCFLLVSLPQPLVPVHVIPSNRSSGLELSGESRICLPNLSFLSAIFGDGIHLLYFYLPHVRYKNEKNLGKCTFCLCLGLGNAYYSRTSRLTSPCVSSWIQLITLLRTVWTRICFYCIFLVADNKHFFHKFLW